MNVKVVGRFIERKKTKKRPEKDQLTNKVSVTTGPGLRSVEFTSCGLSSYIHTVEFIKYGCLGQLSY